MKTKGHLHSFPVARTGMLETAVQYIDMGAALRTKGGSTMKHTKGPWRRGSYGDGGIEGQFEGTWTRLANVGDVSWPGLYDKTRRFLTESEANFQLMLAAPDLLEALKNLLEFAYQMPALQPGGWEGRIIEAARAAIAKAKGQEND